MSDLLGRIEADLKAAMREKNELARDTLRMLLAGCKNRRIELGRDLADADVLDVARKAVKSRQDSADQYEKAGRAELAEKERGEISVLEGYLPAQKSPAEIEAIVQAAIEEIGASTKADLGRVMKAVLGKHQGEVDGKAVSQVAGRLLS